MATQEPEQDNALSKVARSVGSALGTVASKVNDLVGDKPEDEKLEGKAPEESDKKAEKSESKPAKSSSAAPTKAAPAKKSAAGAAVKSKSRAQQVKKLKRDKHRRKLGRKTRG